MNDSTSPSPAEPPEGPASEPVVAPALPDERGRARLHATRAYLGPVLAPRNAPSGPAVEEVACRLPAGCAATTRSTNHTRGILRATALASALLSAGCSGPVSHIPEASSESWRASRERNAAFDPSRKERQVGRSERAQIEALNRVWARVRPAAWKVCTKHEAIAAQCQQRFATIKLVVYSESAEVNAFAAADGTVGFYGGLMRSTGNDEELAMVLAHEVGHVVYGHNQQTATNTAAGGLAGGLVGLGLGVLIAGGSNDAFATQQSSEVVGQLMEDSMRLGTAVGRVAYSPQMELEADQFAAFTLREAGYDVAKGGDMLLRLSRAAQSEAATGGKSFVSYFQTHPANDQRFAQWFEAAREASEGRGAPLSQDQVAKRYHRKVAEGGYCQQVRARYPKCRWWNNKYDWKWIARCPIKPGDRQCIPPKG